MNTYGHNHQQLRKQWAALIATGNVHCTGPQGCGHVIHPTDDWDLGHTIDHALGGDNAPRIPQHAHCNRSAGGALRHILNQPTSTRAL